MKMVLFLILKFKRGTPAIQMYNET